MSAQPQALPVLGRIHLMPSDPVTFQGITKRNVVSEEEKDRTALAIYDYCSRMYINAPYLMGSTVNDVLVGEVGFKYLRSLPDWEPSEELPALNPTITSHDLIDHWIAKVASTTHKDLCRAHRTHREHFPLASDLIADEDDGDGLEWAEGTSRAVENVTFQKLKPNDWCRITRELDVNHPLPESARAWSYGIEVKGQHKPVEALNTPLRASSVNAECSPGQQYKVWKTEAEVIIAQALSQLTAEERALIRKGWKDATYSKYFEKLVKRLQKLNASKVSEGINWPQSLFRELIDSPYGLMGIYDEYSGWSNVNPFLLSELGYHPSHAIPVVEITEPVENDFNLSYPGISDEPITSGKSLRSRLIEQRAAYRYLCSENACRCHAGERRLAEQREPYTGPAPQDERERWLVAIGQQADWKRPDYL
jgi:hypothetical protein